MTAVCALPIREMAFGIMTTNERQRTGTFTGKRMAAPKLALVPKAAPTSATAQLSQREAAILRGISEVEVMVENLSENAHRCGLRQSSLELAAAQPMVEAGITVVESAHVVIYVSTVAVQDRLGERDLGCSVALKLQVFTSADAVLRYQNGAQAPVEVDLWSTQSLLTGPSHMMEERILATIHERLSEFATKVRLANTKPSGPRPLTVRRIV